MPKDPSTEPTRRRKGVIVIVRPFCSPDPNGPNFEQYCKQKLMLYVKFRQCSYLLKDDSTFVEAYQQFLSSDNVPSSLEEDIRSRLPSRRRRTTGIVYMHHVSYF